MFPDRRAVSRVSPRQGRPRHPRAGRMQAQGRQMRNRRNMAAPLSAGRRGFARPAGRRNMAVPKEQNVKKSSIINQLKKEDGQWDLDKIMAVSNQLQKMYGQVSPLISRFVK